MTTSKRLAVLFLTLFLMPVALASGSQAATQNAEPAGVVALELTGDLSFAAGGVSTEYLTGAFVKSASVSGNTLTLTVQFANSNEGTVTFTGGTGGGGGGGGGVTFVPAGSVAYNGQNITFTTTAPTDGSVYVFFPEANNTGPVNISIGGTSYPVLKSAEAGAFEVLEGSEFDVGEPTTVMVLQGSMYWTGGIVGNAVQFDVGTSPGELVELDATGHVPGPRLPLATESVRGALHLATQEEVQEAAAAAISDNLDAVVGGHIPFILAESPRVVAQSYAIGDLGPPSAEPTREGEFAISRTGTVWPSAGVFHDVTSDASFTSTTNIPVDGTLGWQGATWTGAVLDFCEFDFRSIGAGRPWAYRLSSGGTSDGTWDEFLDAFEGNGQCAPGIAPGFYDSKILLHPQNYAFADSTEAANYLAQLLAADSSYANTVIGHICLHGGSARQSTTAPCRTSGRCALGV